MRSLIASALPPNPWLLGAFIAVLAVFGLVMFVSLRFGRPKEIEKEAELPLKD